MQLGPVVRLLLHCPALRENTAEQTLPDYKFFRRRSIDLVGPPSCEVYAAFDKPEFSQDTEPNIAMGIV
jgi:hypothetical protein